MALLTLLTDFGLADYYVAAVKGTVLRLAPHSELVDVSHLVPPGDLAAAAFLLAAAAPAFAAGTVHYAVVDPGVGSPRRILAAHTAAGHWAVAPDNGLLTPLLAGARLWSVVREDIFLAGEGQIFHGRDRFAPVAAWLLRGEPAEALGPEIHDPVRLAAAVPERAPDHLAGTVVHIDRFGNLITDIPSAWLPDPAPPLRAEVGAHATSHTATHYEAIPPRAAALLPGSLGTLELAAAGDDLARRWSVTRGTPVLVRWTG
ncbi:MAG TPA: SAM-dependent chlorinase/fluorinase [Thermoanaerobaculia bacterium]|nr:SAM-dependent chlorinase/fluorinase [Thermoanaerobaculia bacterium]